MNKKIYLKVMSFLIAFIVILCLIIGCSKGETPPQSDDAYVPSHDSTSDDSGDSEERKITDEPIEIRILMQGRPEGPISNDMPWIQEITKKTGIRFKWEQAPADGNQYKEKFNIMLTSGDIPDLMCSSDKTILNRGGVSGIFEPLNEYIDKYMPNVKAKLEEKPEVRKAITNYDGNIYFLARITAVKPLNILIVRKDWLDKLGLKIPTDAQEMYNVLKAFKENDPNGNGEADEIPFTCRGKLASLNPFIECFGLYGKSPFFVENGEVKFTYTDSRYKKALEYLNKLYKEKLIDNEYLTNDQNIWESRLTNGISGMTYDVFIRVDYLNNLIGENVFTGMIPLKGPDGKAVTQEQQNPIGVGTSVSSKSKFKVEIAKFFNWMYSEEGILTTNFGVEGLTYEIVDGEPKYTDLIMKDPDYSPLPKMFTLGFRDHWPYVTDIRYENAMSSEEQIKIRDTIAKHIVPNYPMHSFSYTPEELEVMTSVYPQIETYVNEMVNKFIIGVEPLDKFDEFVEKIDQLGLQEVLKVQQAAYDRYMAS